MPKILTGDATQDPRLPHSSEVIAALAAERDSLLDRNAVLEREHATMYDEVRALRLERDHLAERVRALEEALRKTLTTLTVPAAEYVPAITDAWAIIEEALKEATP